MKTEVEVNANIISWAIDRAGYDMQELSIKFPNLPEWLAQTKRPTIKQLEDFSKKVHLPFGYFFLEKPPIETIPFPFFRTIANQSSTRVSINLYDTILLIQRRQEWVSDYLKDNDYDPIDFVGSYNLDSKMLDIVNDIRRKLGLEEGWALSFNKPDDAINHLTEKIEELGVILTFNGVVENNTSRSLDVDECRGFVMVDSYAPFMFINNADGKGAQMFTIIHELAHIWIGKSAGFDMNSLLPASDPIELLCDSIAAEFLVPLNTFNTLWKSSQNLDFLAQKFKVSKVVIARRALDTNKISRNEFFAFYNSYKMQLSAIKDNQGSGGDFYATQKKRIGIRFAALIDRAVHEGQLLYRDAYKLTGLKGDTFQNFITKTLY